MSSPGPFRVARTLDGDGRQEGWVIVDAHGELHREASDWLTFLSDVQRRSPGTVHGYARKVAVYLSWCEGSKDWRSVRVADLTMFRNAVVSSPYTKTNGKTAFRCPATVRLWMSALRSFYLYADANGLLMSDVLSEMLVAKYYRPGTPAGGEHGKSRKVLAPALRTDSEPAAPPKWIDSAEARKRLRETELNVRDRFVIDLLSGTGIRVGEMLSLFTQDMHVGGASVRASGCRYLDPHLHVRTDNPVENGARAKGAPRVIELRTDLVERYIDYLVERARILGDRDSSPHLFVNLYSPSSGDLGRAMRYQRVARLLRRVSHAIDFDITGPHMLRHTLATRLMQGIECEAQPQDVVAEILGHRDPKSTRIYLHDRRGAMRRALESLEPRVVSLAGDVLDG